MRPERTNGDRVRAMNMRNEWMSVRAAATMLGFTAVSLRRAIERNARRSVDGTIEASFDGLRARKLGRTWRVQLSDAWARRSA